MKAGFVNFYRLGQKVRSGGESQGILDLFKNSVNGVKAWHQIQSANKNMCISNTTVEMHAYKNVRHNVINCDDIAHCLLLLKNNN